MKRFLSIIIIAMLASPACGVTDYRIVNSGLANDPVRFRVYSSTAGWTDVWRANADGSFELFKASGQPATRPWLKLSDETGEGIVTFDSKDLLRVNRPAKGPGTISAVAGSETTTGVGTYFLSWFEVGDAIIANDTAMTITAINSDTSLEAMRIVNMAPQGWPTNLTNVTYSSTSRQAFAFRPNGTLITQSNESKLIFRQPSTNPDNNTTKIDFQDSSGDSLGRLMSNGALITTGAITVTHTGDFAAGLTVTKSGNDAAVKGWVGSGTQLNVDNGAAIAIFGVTAMGPLTAESAAVRGTSYASSNGYGVLGESRVSNSGLFRAESSTNTASTLLLTEHATGQAANTKLLELKNESATSVGSWDAEGDIVATTINASALPAMVGSNGSTGGTKGAVPAPVASDNVKYLRGDGTWQALTQGGAGSDTTAAHLNTTNIFTATTASPLLLRPSSAPSASTKLIDIQTTGTTTSVGSWDAEGDILATSINASALPAMVGANGSTGGTKGAVPAPAATDNTKFLRGDATYQTVLTAAPSNMQTTDTSQTVSGLKTHSSGLLITGGSDQIKFSRPTTGPGTVSGVAGSETVTGSGTIFTKWFAVNDSITVGAETRTVTEITSDTSMETFRMVNFSPVGWDATFNNSAYTTTSKDTFKVFPNGQLFVQDNASRIVFKQPASTPDTSAEKIQFLDSAGTVLGALKANGMFNTTGSINVTHTSDFSAGLTVTKNGHDAAVVGITGSGTLVSSDDGSDISIFGTTASSVAAGSAAVRGQARASDNGYGVFGESTVSFSGLFKSFSSTNTQPTLVIQENTSGQGATVKLVDIRNEAGTSVASVDVDGDASFRDLAVSGAATAPTATAGDNDTTISSTAFVTNAVSTKANLASPTFTGNPLAPTPAAGDNDTSIPTTAYVQTELLDYAPLASPALTGTPTVPTASAGTNTTQAASTAFVTAGLALKANLASPNLTGTPTAPTAAGGTNTTQIATTAYVLSESLSQTEADARYGELATSNTYTSTNTFTVVSSGAVRLQPSSAPSTNTQLFQVTNTGGTPVAFIDAEGDLSALTINADNAINLDAASGFDSKLTLNQPNTAGWAWTQLASGNGTTSSQHAFDSYKLNQTAAREWRAGMINGVNYKIRNETAARDDVTIDATTGGITTGPLTSTGSIKERSRSVAMGEWTSATFAAGDYTCNGCTWTVESSDQSTLAYTLVGKTITLSFYLNSTTVGGTANNQLRVTIPGSFVSQRLNSATMMYQDNGGAWSMGHVATTGGGTTINLSKTDFSNWSASTNATNIRGQITFEIQ